MLSTVGRPREHDEATAQLLLDAAEEIAERDGADALSVRAVAARANTSTRAVYSVFGSKDGLVTALGARAFDMLGAGVAALDTTDDAAEDLAEAGVSVFRPFALAHPSLFQIGIQRTAIPPETAARFRPAANAAMTELEALVERLHQQGLLGGRSVHDAACEFHALCEGLGALELRGAFVAEADAARIWREALVALVRGFALAPAAACAAPRSP